jgi:hypothetical protein
MLGRDSSQLSYSENESVLGGFKFLACSTFEERGALHKKSRLPKIIEAKEKSTTLELKYAVLCQKFEK